MTPQLHSLLMESKPRRLVQEDKHHKETMMMSMEHLHEMYQILLKQSKQLRDSDNVQRFDERTKCPE